MANDLGFLKVWAKANQSIRPTSGNLSDFLNEYKPELSSKDSSGDTYIENKTTTTTTSAGNDKQNQPKNKKVVELEEKYGINVDNFSYYDMFNLQSKFPNMKIIMPDMNSEPMVLPKRDGLFGVFGEKLASEEEIADAEALLTIAKNNANRNLAESDMGATLAFVSSGAETFADAFTLGLSGVVLDWQDSKEKAKLKEIGIDEKDFIAQSTVYDKTQSEHPVASTAGTLTGVGAAALSPMGKASITKGVSTAMDWASTYRNILNAGKALGATKGAIRTAKLARTLPTIMTMATPAVFTYNRQKAKLSDSDYADFVRVQSDYNNNPIGNGNIDLTQRPIYQNEDGTISTVSSMTITEDGKAILIPTIVYGPNGVPTRLTEDEAIEYYHETGEHLGKFDSIKDADEYAKKLSKEQGIYYRNVLDDKKDTPVEWLEKQVAAGNAQYSKQLAASLDLVLPTEIMGKYDLISKVNDFYGDALYATSAEAQKSSSNLGKGWEVAGETVQVVTAALPNSITALFLAGANAPGQATQIVNNKTINAVANYLKQTAKNPQYWTSLLQTIGTDYEEAKKNGANETVASVSAIISSAINAGIELGGIQGLPDKLIKQLSGDVSKRTVRNLIVQWATSMLEEGYEEVLQGIVTNLTAKMLYNHNAPILSTTDENAVINPIKALKEFSLGAVAGGFLGGGQIAAIETINRGNISRIGNYMQEFKDEVIAVGLNSPQDTESYKLAQKLNKKSGNISDYNLGKLHLANLDQLEVKVGDTFVERNTGKEIKIVNRDENATLLEITLNGKTETVLRTNETADRLAVEDKYSKVKTTETEQATPTDEVSATVENETVETAQNTEELVDNEKNITDSTPRNIHLTRSGNYYEIYGEEALALADAFGVETKKESINNSETDVLRLPADLTESLADAISDEYNLIMNDKVTAKAKDEKVVAENATTTPETVVPQTTPSVKVDDVYEADGKTYAITGRENGRTTYTITDKSGKVITRETSNVVADINFTKEDAYTKVQDGNNRTATDENIDKSTKVLQNESESATIKSKTEDSSVGREENSNEQGRANLLYDNGKWDNNGGSQKPTERILSFRRRNQGKNATERADFARGLIQRGLVEEKSTDNAKYNLVKPEAYNDDMLAMVEDAKRRGVELRFFVGRMEVEVELDDGTKVTKLMSGLALPSSQVAYVQYDDTVESPQQIYKHELCHTKWYSPEMQKIKNTILNSLTEAEKQKIKQTQRFKDYMTAYKNKEKICWEEFVCDVMAGKTQYTANFIDTAYDYWYGSESIDSYSPAEYTTSTDAGGRYNLSGASGYPKWTEDVLDDFEFGKLESALLDIESGANANYYNRSANGEYIIQTDNKLIYTNGKHSNPDISKIIEFNSEYESEIDEMRRRIYEVEKGKSEFKMAYRIIERAYGQGSVIEHTGHSNATNGKSTGLRKGNGSKGNSPNGGTKKQRRNRYVEEIRGASKQGLKAIQKASQKLKKSGIRYNLADSSYAPTFYSHMGKTIDEMKQDKIGANSVVSYLKGRGVKDEEIKWSGIETFLEGKKSVTKAELQEFIAGNQLQIETETRLSDYTIDYTEDESKSLDEISKVTNEIWRNIDDLWEQKYGSEIAWDIRYNDNAVSAMYREINRLQKSDAESGSFFNDIIRSLNRIEVLERNQNTIVERAKARTLGEKANTKTKWDDYKLDGGSNYREFLFKLPDSTYSNSAMRTHWDNTEGVLAHARVQDFEVDGKNMLFIEEIQSDWHNEGASRGYQSKLSPNEQNTVMDITDKRTQLFNELRDVLEEIRKTAENAEKQNLSAYEQGQLTAPLWEKAHRLREEERALLEESQKIEGTGNVPDAPFRNNYHEYVLKSLIRMAAEQGYDSIGWTTADIQSERWSEQFAEGYRIEYDQDIPKFLNKYGKKWDAKVGKTTLDNGNNIWSMPITDSMRDSVLYEGQARYNISAEQETEYLELAKEPEKNDARLREMVDEVAKANGYNIKAYHGTSRADRVGTVFRPDRATSGPMAYFTDSEEIASNYARDKADTSLAYDEEYDSYYTQFRVNRGGKSISIPDLWKYLSISQKNKIKEIAGHIKFDDDYENIIVDKSAEHGNGAYDAYTLNMHRGNVLEALVDTWLETGDLYNREADFLEVLKLVGIEDAEYKDPDARQEKVYDTWLKIQNPFDTDFADSNFYDALSKWIESHDMSVYEKETSNADMWDKNNQTPETWLEKLNYDIENGTTHAWTVIPDFVTDYLKEQHFDGIKDKGGKNGGDSHTVWIPFSSEQIKSAEPVTYDDNGDIIPLSKRFNSEKDDIRWNLSGEDADIKTQKQIESIAQEIGSHEELIATAKKNTREFVGKIKENKSLQKRLHNAKRQMLLSPAPNVNATKVGKITKEILKEMDSTLKASDLREEVMSIYNEYFASIKKAGGVESKTQEANENMMRRFAELAVDIADSSEVFVESDDYMMIKAYVKNTRIKVPDWAKSDVDYAAFRKAHMGTFNLTNDGLDIDVAYAELCEIFPGIFNPELHSPSDQLFEIANTLEKLKPYAYNPNTGFMLEAIDHIVYRFVSEVDGLATMPKTKAQKMAEKSAYDKEMALEKERVNFERKFEKQKKDSETLIRNLQKKIDDAKYVRYWEKRLDKEEKAQAIKELRERRDVAVLKSRIRSIVSDMKKNLDKSEKAGGYPKELVKVTAEICSVLDFHTGKTNKDGTPTKVSLKLDALKMQYDALKNNENYDFKSEHSEELSGKIGELHNLIKDKRVTELNVYELSQLKDILSEISHRLSNARKQIGLEKARENAAIGTEIISSLNSNNDVVEFNKKQILREMKLLGQKGKAFILNPHRINEMIAGYDKNSAWWNLYDAINRGSRKASKFVMEANKPFDELIDGGGNEIAFYDFRTKKIKTGIKYIDGSEVEVPKSIICELVMAWERKQGRTHLEADGAKIPDMELYNKGKTTTAITDGGRRTKPITPMDIARLKQMLDSYDLEWIDKARHLFNKTTKDAINETSMELLGRELAKTENYIRLYVDRDFIRREIDGNQYDSTLESHGSLKETTPNAKQPIILRGLHENVYDQIDFAAKYYGLAIPIRNFNKVYNTVILNDGERHSVRETVGKKFGSNIQLNVVEQLIQDLQAPRKSSIEPFGKIRGNWLGATFWGNIRSTLKQTTSYWTASAIIGEDSLAKGLAQYARNSKQTKAEINKYSGTLYKRSQGLSTTELGDRANAKRLAGASNKVTKFINEHAPALRKIPKWIRPGNWLQSMDCAVASALWEACKIEASKTMNTSDDGYMKFVTDLYERVIEETQSNYDVTHRPEALKNTNTIVRTITMFQTDNLQQTGIIYSAFYDYKTKADAYKKDSSSANESAKDEAKNRLSKAIRSRVYSSLWLVFATMLGDMLLRKFKPYVDDEEKDITSRSILKQAMQKMCDDMFGVFVPVGGQLITSAMDTWSKGYDFVTEPSFEAIQEFIEATSKIWDSASEGRWEDTKDAVADAIPAISNFTGIPAKNISDLINAVKGYASDVKSGDFAHDITDYASSKSFYSYDDLASCIISGDAEKEKKITDYYSASDKEVEKSAITKAIKPAYVQMYIDSPEKAYNIKRKLILDYDYTADSIDEWAIKEYLRHIVPNKKYTDGVVSNPEYAAEIKSAVEKNVAWSSTSVQKTVKSHYKQIYKDGNEKDTKALRDALLKDGGFFEVTISTWEREADNEIKKEQNKANQEKKKFE